MIIAVTKVPDDKPQPDLRTGGIPDQLQPPEAIPVQVEVRVLCAVPAMEGHLQEPAPPEVGVEEIKCIKKKFL